MSRVDKSLFVLALIALDIALILCFSGEVALVAAVSTATITVLLALRALIRCGNKGPCKTLY